MLQTALQLARSLGREGTGGNATLGLWLGQKFESQSPCIALLSMPWTDLIRPLTLKDTLRRNGDEKKADAIAT